MKKAVAVAAIALWMLLLAACGSGSAPTPAAIIAVATPTATPSIVTVIASPTPLPPEPSNKPTPGAADTLPTLGPSPQAPPGDSLDPDDFWASFPLPQDAELAPVVEGIDLAFTTNMVEPQVFDYLAAWLESQGWQQQAPTEAMVSLPHQRWRKDVAELLIEIPGLDSDGRTEVWVQMTYLIADAPPEPTGSSRDTLPALDSPVPPATPTPAAAPASVTLAPTPAAPAPTSPPPTPSPPDSDIISPDNVHQLAEANWTHVGPNALDLAWSQVPGRPLAVSESARLHLYDPASLDSLSLPGDITATHLAFSPDGVLLAVTRFDDPMTFYVDLWRADDWTLARSLEGHENIITNLAFSPDGRWLASASMESSVRVWDVGSGQMVRELRPEYQGVHSPAVLSADWSPDGQYLAAGMYGGWIEGWATEDWAQIFRFQASDSNQPTLVFPLPGDRLLTLNGYTANLWNLVGASLARMESEWGFYGGDVNPNGNLLASGSLEGVEVWDLDRAQVLHRMAIGNVRAAAFGNHGAQLATMEGSDDLLRLWAIGTGQESRAPGDQYSEVWQRLGGAAGRLGRPLGPPETGTFAFQHFERGLMHWGRWDREGEPEREVQVVVYGNGGQNRKSGDLWGRFVDYWQEGEPETSCPEATAPNGPRRGFGLVWCRYVRDSLGAPLEEEYGQPAGYQDFETGTLLWSPSDEGIYVLFNTGDWQFEPVK